MIPRDTCWLLLVCLLCVAGCIYKSEAAYATANSIIIDVDACLYEDGGGSSTKIVAVSYDQTGDGCGTPEEISAQLDLAEHQLVISDEYRSIVVGLLIYVQAVLLALHVLLIALDSRRKKRKLVIHSP